MKKLTAIFLLLLLLFNVAGYRIFFEYANTILDTEAQILFDNDQYVENESVIIKVPLNMPYQNDQSDFQRVDGKININGKIYRYVKRKIVDNEIILVCVADNNATKLNKGQTDFFKITAGLTNNESSKKTGSDGFRFIKALPVYHCGNSLSYHFLFHKITEAQNAMLISPKLLTLSKEPPVQPPDII